MSELKYYDIRNVNDHQMMGVRGYEGAATEDSVKVAINDIFIFLTQELGLTYIRVSSSTTDTKYNGFLSILAISVWHGFSKSLPTLLY